MNHVPGVKKSRSGIGHPQGRACDREKRETQELTSNYLLVRCSTLTGLEQHLISQTVEGWGGEMRDYKQIWWERLTSPPL